MLAGVLLHVVEASRPIDAAVHGSQMKFAVDDMDDFFSFIANIQDLGFVEAAEIVRLAARGGIKSSRVEHHRPGSCGAVRFRLAALDLCVELALEGIVV